ncbi:Putative nucleolar protein 10/Enp2 [Septoria linicola]|uniref:Nucleolar protein 10/Enp2 n=1 Tax=Septoria linicola TaxID=215465 RepID=A0A9Q9EG85_9PEZI|nr:Putative nucleolar protein 10/Enp2 [Septoria linicola]
MKLTNSGAVPVYTIAGASTARPLPEWLARKRKRSLKADAEYAHRVELLQDFEFDEASQCVRVSDDGEWVMSTGTYKPQIHAHYLPHLSLSFARHTNTVNETFVLLSQDYTKSLHLQTDRFLEFHNPGGLHYSTRIPRYGRDLKYNSWNAEALVPAVGVNANGNGEVFRLNLELGRFMKGYEVDVGGDDVNSFGSGALQGGVNTGAVNCAAIADQSHGLLAFGTSLGTVEFWDARSRNRASVLGSPALSSNDLDGRPEITALSFHRSGLALATGNSNGIVRTYDLRSPLPLLEKQQGYDNSIRTLQYIESPLVSAKVLSADRKGIKLWDATSGDYWTGIEPAVDLNHVEWIPSSGMLLTANEGRQQHAFFIPQLGPAPKWCAFLDNLVEEMAEDSEDPHAFKSAGAGVGEVYDNYKFVDMKQLRELSLDHLVGTTNLLRPYMHGYFVAQKLYEQARLLTNPDLAEQQRQKSIQEKIDKERESRIRGSKKVAVKVNRKFAETLAAREEANERRKAQRVLRQGGDEPAPTAASESTAARPLLDDRFKSLFENEDFEIDEHSREFAMHNPSTVPSAVSKPRGLTAVEEEALDDARHGSSDDDDNESGDEDAEEVAARQRQRQRQPTENSDSKGRIGSTSYKSSGKRPQSQRQNGPPMRVSNSTQKVRKPQRDKSFGDLATSLPARSRQSGSSAHDDKPFGEKQITFAPSSSKQKKRPQQRDGESDGRAVSRAKERRSASGNVFRRI